MPDHSPSTDERASVAQLSQSSLPLECTSHLGFGLEGPGRHCQHGSGHACPEPPGPAWAYMGTGLAT